MADFDTKGALSSAAAGALAGSAFGPVGTVAGGLIGIAPSVFKFFSGSSQKRQADAINPINPGYEMNRQVIDNARILRDRYGNYTMPGYGQAQNQINNNFQNAFSQGVQGASSGGDVSDLAAKLAYGKNIAEQNLETQNAQGKEAALGQYLDANAAAGRESQAQNAYERDQYNRQLLQKAALTQAGNTNEYNALDTGASVLSGYLNPKQMLQDQTIDTNVKKAGSIFQNTTSENPIGTSVFTDTPQVGQYNSFTVNPRYNA